MITGCGTGSPIPRFLLRARGPDGTQDLNWRPAGQRSGWWPFGTACPGVTPVKKFKDRTTAATWIWKSIQQLGEAAKPETQPVQPKAERKAKGGTQAARARPRTVRRQESHGRQEHAQGQTGRPDAGSRRAARGQYDGPGGGHAPAEERSHSSRDIVDAGWNLWNESFAGLWCEFGRKPVSMGLVLWIGEWFRLGS